MPVKVTGIGPYIKRDATKLFVSGSGFSRGDVVQISILNLVTRETTIRAGVVESPVTDGYVVRLTPLLNVNDVKPLFDDDLAEITVTITNNNNESDDSTQTGIVE